MEGAPSEAIAKARIHRLAKTGMLAALREERGLSQGDVARHVRVSPSSVSRWEDLKTKPRGRHAVALLELLDGPLTLAFVMLLLFAEIRADRIYTVREAAALLRVSAGTYYDAARRGEVPAVRIGRRLVVPGAALVRLLQREAS